MKIIIIGDGKVGYKLARQLSTEKYDVVLIDSDEKKLRFATDHLDIACVAGNGADAEVLKQADIAHADLAIACTSEDECNMLSCLIARKLGARHTIARVRNPIYYRQIGLLKEDLHLSMAVNPELIVADEISRLLIFRMQVRSRHLLRGEWNCWNFRSVQTEFWKECGYLICIEVSDPAACLCSGAWRRCEDS